MDFSVVFGAMALEMALEYRKLPPTSLPFPLLVKLE